MPEVPHSRVLLTALVVLVGVAGCMPVIQVSDRGLRTNSSEVRAIAALPNESTLAANDAPQDFRQTAAIPDLSDFGMAAGDAPEHPAAARIAALGDEVITALDNPGVGKAERKAILCRVLARDVDIPPIARFALGRYWNRIDPVQREAYMVLFKDFLVQTYAARLSGVRINRFEVIEAQPVGKADILVQSRVESGEHKAMRADWRVRERDGRYLILDLSVEGISMAVTLRQEFAAILQRGGIADLLEMMRRRASA